MMLDLSIPVSLVVFFVGVFTTLRQWQAGNKKTAPAKIVAVDPRIDDLIKQVNTLQASLVVKQSFGARQ